MESLFITKTTLIIKQFDPDNSHDNYFANENYYSLSPLSIVNKTFIPSFTFTI